MIDAVPALEVSMTESAAVIDTFKEVDVMFTSCAVMLKL